MGSNLYIPLAMLQVLWSRITWLNRGLKWPTSGVVHVWFPAVRSLGVFYRIWYIPNAVSSTATMHESENKEVKVGMATTQIYPITHLKDFSPCAEISGLVVLETSVPLGRMFPPWIRVLVLLFWKQRLLPGFLGHFKLLNYRERSGLLVDFSGY